MAKGLLEDLSKDGQLMAYRHDSFWQCMDTLPEIHIGAAVEIRPCSLDNMGGLKCAY